MGEMASAEQIRQKVLDDSNHRCCMCSPHIGFRVEVLPIVPLSEGGSFQPSNLAVLCPFCRWLVQRQKISPTGLRLLKKQWQSQARKAPDIYESGELRIVGQPLRMESTRGGVVTVLEGSELSAMLSNFFNCLDTFLIHEDQHLENASSLAVIRAFRDMYSYVPSEQDIKTAATADSRKLDLLYRGIRELFAVGLGRTGRSAARKSAEPATKAEKSDKPQKVEKPAVGTARPTKPAPAPAPKSTPAGKAKSATGRAGAPKSAGKAAPPARKVAVVAKKPAKKAAKQPKAKKKKR